MRPFAKFSPSTAIAKIALVVAFVAHMSDGRPSNRLWEEIDDYLAPNPLAFEYTESTQDCGFTKLSERIVPSHYDIVLEPNPANLAAFEGAVRVSVGVRPGDGPADQIVLHADRSLKIELVWYTDLGQSAEGADELDFGRWQRQAGNLVAVRHVCRDQASQLLVVSVERSLEPNSRGQLHLTFAGAANDADSSSSAGHGQPQVLFWGASSLDAGRPRAALARTAFPCFDEPALKATFALTLIQPADHVALSNAHSVDEQPIEEAGDGEDASSSSSTGDSGGARPRRKLVRFAKTPRMSPHLLALALGQFELSSERQSSYDEERPKTVSVRVYIQKDRVANGQASLLAQFAIDAASRALATMQDYFGAEYPLQKLDFLAVPALGAERAAAAGGWGLVVASEKTILIDDWYAGPEEQAQTLETVLRELTRQWLGNLVTVDAGAYDARLSEGLVSLMMYKFGQELFPRFEFQYRYLIDSHLVALEEEAGSPFSCTIDHHSQLAHLLPSHKKATAIVRAVQENLGEDEFKQAIRKYLHKHQFGTAGLDDLCRTFDHESVAAASSEGQHSSCDLLRSFDNQSGCPLIEASINGGECKLGLEQKRFSASREVANGPELAESWPRFPIVLESPNCCSSQEPGFTRDTIQGQRLAFELSEGVSTATNGGSCGYDSLSQHQYWLKLNANFTGFYRVLYDGSLFELMRKPIEHRTLTPADRLNLLDETRALALATRVPAMRLLNLIIWSQNEDNGAVLVALVEAYKSLMDIVKEDSNLGARLTLFGHQLFGKIYHTKLGAVGASESEQNHMEMRARAAVLNLLVDENYQPAINESIELLVEADTMVPFHLREPVYAAVTKGARDHHQGWLFAKLESTASREERARLTVSLARAVEPGRLLMIWRWLRQKNLAIDADQKLRALENLLASKQGLEFVLQLARDKGSKEVAALGAARPMVTLVLKQLILTGKVSDPQEAARAYPELFDSRAQRGLAADWPEEAEELIELRARRAHALQGSYQELQAALSTL